MTAVNRPLSLEQGATYRIGFTWRNVGPLDTAGNVTPGDPIDLSGCTARMQIRRSLRQPVLVYVQSGDGITIDGPNGYVLIELSDEKTDALDIKRGVYDLEVEFPSGDVYRVLEGAITVDRNVTRTDLAGDGVANDVPLQQPTPVPAAPVVPVVPVTPMP